MIFLAGDIEGLTFISRLVKYFEYREDVCEDDYLILLVDTQMCIYGNARDYQVEKILNELPLTVLFVDGNHENFDIIDDIEIREWNGGKVQYLGNIIHLMRGQVNEIEGKKFFTFGGAYSWNKREAIAGRTWWEQEIPNEEEYEEGWRNLEKTIMKWIILLLIQVLMK